MNSTESVWEEECAVLQAIYAEQFRLVGDRAFEIALAEHSVHANFALKPDYPLSLPTITIHGQSGRLDTFGLTKLLLGEAGAMLGEPMIFNLMTLIIDHIDDYTTQVAAKEAEDGSPDDTRTYTPIEARVIEQGTAVTRESFERWRLGFIAECDPEAFEGSKAGGRLTGRQLFEQTLVRADDDGGDGDDDDRVLDVGQMVSDRSLFLDLDGLDSSEE